MNDNERPLDAGTPEAEQPQPFEEPAELQASIEQLTEEGAAAAAEEAAALEEAAEAVGAAGAEGAAADLPPAEPQDLPEVAAEAPSGTGTEAADAEPQPAGPAEPAAAEAAPEAAPPAAAARSSRLADRLAEEMEYDPDATQDDRLLAALAYGAQLIVPVLPPLILLIAEASKRRPFQRYHAVQSLALGIVVWGLGIGLGTLAAIAAASVIGLLCLCFIVPAMIVLWLLPLYYALLAYSGKRFRIPGLTQFLKDQRWL
ncbi:MAG: DUF4870 domain-containing protein [Caldilineales bacterium]|nr:DUF4870 domain-containing protein [Caldilineales bacterium]